jgi:hypothetical protein
MASLIDMVLEYKLGGRTNQVADALRQSWRHLSVRQWQPPTGLQTYRIVFEMGLKKDPREAFCTKLRNAKLGLDQGRALGHKRESTFFSSKTFLFSVCRSASKECHARAERKQSRGKSFDCVLNIDPCLSSSTS